VHHPHPEALYPYKFWLLEEKITQIVIAVMNQEKENKRDALEKTG